MRVESVIRGLVRCARVTTVLCVRSENEEQKDEEGEEQEEEKQKEIEKEQSTTRSQKPIHKFPREFLSVTPE